jgi:precorrin-2/cobalt-factor-2 C20-methyltransferase
MAATLHIVGMGPGDPELLTLKAARILAATRVVAFFAKRGQPGHARRIAEGLLRADAELLRCEYPYTTEIAPHDHGYVTAMAGFYDASADAIAVHLDAGRDLALLCEGDPLFYGSAMYMFDRLAARHRIEIVPGVTGMSACWTQARLPLAHGDDVFSVLPGTLAEGALIERLQSCDAAVVMKVGRNLEKIKAAARAAGVAARAVYVERGTMRGERVLPLEEVSEAAPYFSLVLVPGRRRVR